MDITPTPAFMEAVRQTLGITQLIPGPDVVLPAIRDRFLSSIIQERHAEITASKAGQAADEAAAEMKRKLDGGLTPADMGWPYLSPTELVASEWKRWFDEDRVIAHVGHVDPSDSSSPYRN